MFDILEVIKQSEAFENFTEVVRNNRELTIKDEIDKIYNEKTNKGKRTFKSYEDALLSIAEVEPTEDGYQISLKCRIGQDQGKKFGYAIFSVIARPVEKLLQVSGKSVAKFKSEEDETILEEEIDDLLLMESNTITGIKKAKNRVRK